MQKNKLYYGDNLDVLRGTCADETVDLVYLDPPFNSNPNYNVLFAEKTARAPPRRSAFEDTWQWDSRRRARLPGRSSSGADASRGDAGLPHSLGNSDMMAYLAMMAPRLVE